MKSIFLILFALISHPSVSQNAQFIFKILDKNSQKCIPYVQAWFINSKVGFCSNEFGIGVLKPTQRQMDILKNDSLVFQALSYKKFVSTLNNKSISDTNFIYLSAKSITLPEVNIDVSTKTKLIKLGNYRRNLMPGFAPKQQAGTISWIVGRYIKNITSRNPKIRSVSFFIANEGCHNAPFRVRIYSVNDSFWPKNDLLNRTITISSDKENQWVTVDLNIDNIALPDSGVVVALEWISVGDEFYYTSKYDSKCYGATLGLTYSKENNFRKGHYFNTFTWTALRLPKAIGSNTRTNYPDPLIYIEVEVPK